MEEYESYESFARVYDELMDNVPYDEWARFYIEKLKSYGIEEGLVCDLGCGTGNMTMRLAKAGFDMIGVDNSEEMLLIARGKKAGEADMDSDDRGILYLLQDMREFELYGTVRACISVCDCVNYVLDEEELMEVFRLVNNYLDPKGVFVFDFNTTYKYKEIIGDAVIAENREDCSFIWENFYEEEEQINEYDLTIFARREDGLFEKFTETHLQRGYTLSQMMVMLEKAGLVFAEAIDMDTKGAPCETSERICVVARENGK
ncbi:MAG: class I SAM-dependent methyltransferase [Lachnospiraceae bacterium]|nr:class I SAM-dependent methyltransferase [Lachnospiraceae bacterium]